MKNYGKKSAHLLFLALTLLVFNGCNTNIDREIPKGEPVAAPDQIIPIEEAEAMYKEYSKRRVPLIQKYEDSINGAMYDQDQGRRQEKMKDGSDMGPKKFDVARYVHYDYQTLKRYMDYIEAQTTAAHEEISTIRFYFSEYPNEPTFPGTKDSIKHPRQNTLVITPAIKRKESGAKNRDYIYYIDDSDPANPKVVYLNDNFGPLMSTETGDANGGDDKSYASFLPNISTPNNSAARPFYDGTSVTMNRGGGAPPNN